MLGKKASRQIHIFGGNPHFAPVALPEACGCIFQIRHTAHIDPGLRHSHDHIRMAKTQRGQQNQPFGRILDIFADQIFAGNPQMRPTRRQLGGNF